MMRQIISLFALSVLFCGVLAQDTCDMDKVNACLANSKPSYNACNKDRRCSSTQFNIAKACYEWCLKDPKVLAKLQDMEITATSISEGGDIPDFDYIQKLEKAADNKTDTANATKPASNTTTPVAKNDTNNATEPLKAASVTPDKPKITMPIADPHTSFPEQKTPSPNPSKPDDAKADKKGGAKSQGSEHSGANLAMKEFSLVVVIMAVGISSGLIL